MVSSACCAISRRFAPRASATERGVTKVGEVVYMQIRIAAQA